MIFPKKLQKGDTIALVSPAGFIADKTSLKTAITLLKSWGLKVVLGEHIYTAHFHFAGTDKQRTNDFQKALDNPNVQAIWCCKGGYGSIRIIDKLDFTTFLKNPKWLVGYSDISIFLSHLHNIGVASIHSFMPTSIDSLQSKTAVSSLYNALFGKKLEYTITPSTYNKLGTGKGQLVGGNLAVLTSLLGSKTSIDTTNKILFIEDIGEYKYKIDRMLYSLKRAGYFEHCKGLLVGSFTKIPVNNPLFGKEVEEIILDTTLEYDFPICFDFPAGHITDNNALIIGDKVVLEVNKNDCKLDFNGTT